MLSRTIERTPLGITGKSMTFIYSSFKEHSSAVVMEAKVYPFVVENIFLCCKVHQVKIRFLPLRETISTYIFACLWCSPGLQLSVIEMERQFKHAHM